MDRIEISAELLHALRYGAVAVVASGSVFEVSGPSAGGCLQGLHTNDVEQRGPDALVYGAFLTPKGMIVADYWAARSGADYLLFGDRAGRADTVELFRRRLPPRLAKATDRSDEWAILYLLGPKALEIGGAALTSPEAGGLATPAAGRVTRAADGSAWVGHGPNGAPFALVAVGRSETIEGWAEAAIGRGARRAGDEALRAARVLAGAPTLGAEIGERTLPQEVRYDELDGVSYAKGCYVGQETVARVHFRGRPNWLLRGLRFAEGATEVPEADEAGVRAGEKEIGRVTTALVGGTGAPLALAILRREIEPGAAVATALGPAEVTALPLG
ncbi:MAG: folate-binding protein YgfZ [Gemmatimonadales bacterium]